MKITMPPKSPSKTEKQWTFFSNHGHTIILLHRNPELTVREMATTIGITERALLSILSDLQEYGCVSVKKEGRRNRYKVLGSAKFRHSIEGSVSIASLLQLFSK